jgi:hypothetical protein
VYAGFYVISNFVRPLRVALAVAIGPKFDSFVSTIQKRTGASRPVAIFLTVMLANLVGTSIVMASGISLAAWLARVPIFPPKSVV